MSKDLMIYQKWEDMAAYAYIVLRSLPKSERFTLGAEIRQAIWRGVRIIIKAGNERSRSRKISLLWELDGEIKSIQAMTRIGHDMRIISARKNQNLSARLVELGKMTGGWIKSKNTRQ